MKIKVLLLFKEGLYHLINDVVPLGYKSKIASDFKIAIDQVDGFLVNNRIFLEDKLLEKSKT
jgi:hypothetical protein